MMRHTFTAFEGFCNEEMTINIRPVKHKRIPHGEPLRTLLRGIEQETMRRLETEPESKLRAFYTSYQGKDYFVKY